MFVCIHTHSHTHTHAHDSTHTHTHDTHTHTHSVDILRVDGDDSLTATFDQTQTSSMNVPGQHQTCSESEANIFFCSHDSCEYRTPCNLIDSECTDDSSFIDAKGWGCAAWCGYDCSEYDTYTAAELTAVQTNCSLSCNLCSGGKNAKGMAPTCPNGGTACCCDIDSSCTDGDDDWCCPEAS